MKNFVINFMISYTAMLGTFCVIFLSSRLVIGNLNASIIAILVSICALFVSKVTMMEISKANDNIKN